MLDMRYIKTTEMYYEEILLNLYELLQNKKTYVMIQKKPRNTSAVTLLKKH